jgi:predicted alpha/beta hydrolase
MDITLDGIASPLPTVERLEAPVALATGETRFEVEPGVVLGAWHHVQESAPGTPSKPRASIVIASGTGIEQGFYAPFAKNLAAHGFAVTTFDYRGIGASSVAAGLDPAHLRDGMRAWARDLDAVLAQTRRRAPQRPLFVVAHSFGGQALGLAHSAREVVDGAILVGSQSGWYGHWPEPARTRMRLVWRGLMPGLLAAFGRIPRWAAGFDLPGPIAREWTRWCTSPGYLADHVPSEARMFGAMRFPIAAYAFPDDDYAPEPAVRALLAWYRNAEIDLRLRSPRRIGVRSIGHFGFFRSSHQELWREAVDTLEGWLVRRFSHGPVHEPVPTRR